ncbi:MAG: hypothetical protein M1834_009147 [Cirrosporium novae-zelandiae]|nr:MAG: hypothetical protein M1834_009147 [Cirrosporium novae-zelandiae]
MARPQIHLGLPEHQKRHNTPKISCPKPNCHFEIRRDKKIDFELHMRRSHPEMNTDQCRNYFKSIGSQLQPMANLCCPSEYQLPSDITTVDHTLPQNFDLLSPSTDRYNEIFGSIQDDTQRVPAIPHAQANSIATIHPTLLQTPSLPSTFTDQNDQVFESIQDVQHVPIILQTQVDNTAPTGLPLPQITHILTLLARLDDKVQYLSSLLEHDNHVLITSAGNVDHYMTVEEDNDTTT